MGYATLEFDPRICLKEFIDNKSKMSLIRRIKGRKSSKNMLINGENLASLAALKAGAVTSGNKLSVDVILIDPPYNVGGNQSYKNTWKGQSEKERDWAGDHGEFLDFMEPRLKIGRSLLTEEGIMFVNICDGEYCRLKILMDEIFGEENEIATFVWNKKQGAAGSHAVTVHEYIICYAKNKKNAPPLLTKKESAQKIIDKAKTLFDTLDFDNANYEFKQWLKVKKRESIITASESLYNIIHPNSGRVFMADNTCAQDDPKGRRCRKAIKHPLTKEYCPVPKNGWKWKEETLDRLVKENKIWFGKDHNVMPRIIRFLDEQITQLPNTILNFSSNGKNHLPDGIEFTTPKPIDLVKTIISYYPKKNSIILDYFAGSGTTAHAIHELNEEDNGDRSWIMIEEMGSTFHEALLPRVEYFDPNKDFSIYELKEAKIGTTQLMDAFQQHSFEFLSAYHTLDENISISIEGMNILGVDKDSNQIIAITMPHRRKNNHFFEEELAVLKNALNQSNAKKVLIYSIAKHGSKEEPWLGVDKSILSSTKCRQLRVVEIPEQLVDEWNEVLTAMAA